MQISPNSSKMLQGVLPKEYTSFEQDLLYNLVRIFDREELRKATGDVFGRIYEYFLNKFAMSGAQEGGEFFTPEDEEDFEERMREIHLELASLNEEAVELAASIAANFEELTIIG